MTVYNEVEFVDYAIRSCLPFVDHLVIVEGAYQETIDLGSDPRSTDGTLSKLEEIYDLEYIKNTFNLDDEDEIEKLYCKLHVIQANAQTDKDQRNLGLEKIKEINPDGWCLIIDGDEVYDKNTLNMVKVAAHTMEKQDKLAAYFKSMTFVNDFQHYTEQEFPRLFRITSECKFINDNFMEWTDRNIGWFSPYILKIPYIRYHHYAFCKGIERFELKKKWWESRFDEPFDYGWQLDATTGEITDPNHNIVIYTGTHPGVMKSHHLWKESYGT